VAFHENLLSSLKSNTAEASNVIQLIRPIIFNVAIQPAIIIDLACSTVMFFTISTPLKAIVFLTNELNRALNYLNPHF
jgi:hypothetical protein